jgi:hypothetical protein
VAKNIEEGKVGGLFNIKSVEKIKEVQRIAVEKRLKSVAFLGCDSRLRNYTHSLGLFFYLGYEID